jgi:hypothetical protein
MSKVLSVEHASAGSPGYDEDIVTDAYELEKQQAAKSSIPHMKERSRTIVQESANPDPKKK